VPTRAAAAHTHAWPRARAGVPQVGETVSFLLGRFLLRTWVAELTSDWPMWLALNAALREDGWKLVALLRLSPAIPFSIINYALGSSSLPVRTRGGRAGRLSAWSWLLAACKCHHTPVCTLGDA
jgi:hypothetical protein